MNVVVDVDVEAGAVVDAGVVVRPVEGADVGPGVCINHVDDGEGGHEHLVRPRLGAVSHSHPAIVDL